MNIYHYTKKNLKAYSPKGIMDLYEQALKDEKGDGRGLLNKHKYKTLWELYHASFLALAINKQLKKQYYLYPADNSSSAGSPDVLFLDEKNKRAFSVEVTELHSNAEAVWKSKGNKHFYNCHLLIVSRLKSPQINVTEFAREIQKYNWDFEKIWLSVYTASSMNWTFFGIFPPAHFTNRADITFSAKNKADMAFYY